MNYFFDTSALVKLYHPELGSQGVAAMFGEPDRRIVISRLGGVEFTLCTGFEDAHGSSGPRKIRRIAYSIS